jgi:uncharacterized protein GlcG (DUF336 family)
MPVEQLSVSLEEAQRAVTRILEEARRDQNRPIAIAVTDPQGELVTFARMDRCGPQPPTIARKKAYTAARTRSDTQAYGERLRQQNRSVAEFGDPNLLALQGGVVIPGPQQSVLGGIGVSGRSAEEDEQLAKQGLQAIGQR